ncbi:putative low-complexity protein [Hyphomonas adhaerens MHS-3]|uniref:Putative low-complexity protein n=1 Tax=Hyphomonas adhaerens MHS-3 TaxID=1280949 RepID=A0A069E8N9_9PROT|nr:pentapeptide repeat-containing protein [Hyphomonas adhaerens]KCZ84461.1 putative low-complexity protein [Hyphomonas adhaerens MHS-3]
MFLKIDQIIDAPTDNPLELAKVAGCDPKQFFRGASFQGVDVRGLDLSAMDLTGADFTGIVADMSTKAPKEHLTEIREKAFLSLFFSLEPVVTEKNYFDHYADLELIRQFAEELRIGVPEVVSRYFQDEEPEFRSLTTQSFKDPRAVANKALLKEVKRLGLYSRLTPFLSLEFEISAPNNKPPTDEVEIFSIGLESGYEIELIGGRQILVFRSDSGAEFDTTLDLVFSTKAIPRRDKGIELRIQTEEGKVRVDIQKIDGRNIRLPEIRVKREK